MQHPFVTISLEFQQLGVKSHQASPAGGLQDTLAQSGQASASRAARAANKVS
jgi:hypothetical protein